MGSGSKPGDPAPHQAPCLWPGKAVEDGQSLGTCMHVEDPEEFLAAGFRLNQ